MSYTALYRKFRPEHFHDVKGQEHIVTTLKNQIKAGRIGHAYLFTGTRGTGKTTVAKLLAKVVNCQQPEDGNPCNVCTMCKAIANQTSMNVIEIDAASNNGVDNVREIVEEVRYSPTEGKYKVYIIDEVHMLSTGAFNALLKTIEEPPSYVIFILATTEVHKIPATILSRCQRYDFKRISIDTIAARLQDLMKEESIEIEEKALRYIARLGDGSLRDSLSLLEQCISFYMDQKISYDNVLEVLGAVDTTVFSQMLHCIREQNIVRAIQLLEEIEYNGRELGQFTTDFIWYLRNLLLLKTTNGVSEIITEISTENLMMLKEEAMAMDEIALMRYIRVFSDLSNQIRYASRKRIMIEIALIKLCKPQMEQSYEALLERIQILEDKLASGVLVSAPMENKPSVDKKELKPVILPEAVPEDLQEVAKNWKAIRSEIIKNAPSIGPILNSATLSMDGNHGLMIAVINGIDKDFLERESNMKVIKETIAEIIHKQVNVTVKYFDTKTSRVEEVPDLTKIIKVPIEYE